MPDHKSNKIEAVIMAGELEDKFHSETPYLLHTIAGQPIINFSVNAAKEVVGDLPIMALSDDREKIRLQSEGSFKHLIHTEQQSDVQLLRELVELWTEDTDTVLFVRGDMPLLTSTSLAQFISAHLAAADNTTPISLLTYMHQGTPGTRNVGRDEHGVITYASKTSQTSLDSAETIEVEAGVYCLAKEWLQSILPRLPVSPTSGFRLPDLVQIALADKLVVQGIQLANPEEALRIETPIDLAEADRIIRQRIFQKLMLAGVRIIDPNTTYIDAGVEIGPDTVIYPSTYLYGSAKIGSQCTIGPNSLVRDTSVGDRCEILFSVAEGAVLEDDVDIGPFAHLRKGAHLAQGVHMGNYGEVKNSYLGPGTKMGHFSYIGDATIGPGVNIGAGVITANYDGKNKHTTEIGEGAFIGSDSMLVAPLKIGAGARTGAGSVVTKDVPANSLAVGIPARVIRKVEGKDGS